MLGPTTLSMKSVNGKVESFAVFILLAVKKGAEKFPSREMLVSYLKTEMSRFINLYLLTNNGQLIIGHNEEVIDNVSDKMFA